MKVTKLEKIVIEFLEKHLELLLLAAMFVLGCVMRYPPRQFVSDDAADCLLHWYSDIANMGGVHALKYQVGNYGIPYQEFIAFAVYIPFNNALFEIKAFSILFDFSLAIAAGALVRELAAVEKKNILSIVAGGITWCLPTVVMNSALWGQCDSIYSSFILWTLFFVIREKYYLAFIFYGLAFSFKLQAIFILPFLLWYWVCRKGFSLLNLLIIPTIMIVMDLPAIIMGRPIKEVFTVYFDQVQYSDRMFENYPCFLNLMSSVNQEWIFTYLKDSMILLTIAVLILILVWGYFRVRDRAVSEIPHEKFLGMAFLCVYTICMFLPCIHDRYAYPAEILIILIAIVNPKWILPAVAMECMAVYIYGITLNNYPTSGFTIAAVLNVAIYCSTIMLLFKDAWLKERD